MTDEKTAAISSGNPAALTDERRNTHGKFNNTARYIQSIKRVISGALEERVARGDKPLTDQQVESLEMVAHKMGRILSGDPDFQDHWDDIGGYAHIGNKEFDE